MKPLQFLYKVTLSISVFYNIGCLLVFFRFIVGGVTLVN